MINETDLIAFMTKADRNLHLVKHDGNYYHTTRDMFNKGIKVCNLCGKFMPLETPFCKCGQEVFVFFDLPKSETLKIAAAINATRSIVAVKKPKFIPSPAMEFKFTGINLETLETEDLTESMNYQKAARWVKYYKSDFVSKYGNIVRVKIEKEEINAE